ncbi:MULTISPECIES: GntR family transcriptional regulator [Prauserella salsuginis group]|uniref:GntR family transcriptional regulator n=1 Tax=Prauserella salsuginis TaxID=387889 RepID=A0ABW6G289_9PSEU|nr:MULTISPECIES: GntR family transcriptional regulator [Prauserella salsuginis group]MCR3719911.1 GntR family transcriptional regulator [Prauserella flava]MCR3736546.1 GntR family transcriptional regulator [Prauserella salsuginis]
MESALPGLAPFERVAAAIRDAIVTGNEWSPGDQLPSNRALADRYEVSLPTLQRAVGVLREEGWLVSRGSVGVFVADPLPEQKRSETLAELRETVSTLRSDLAALEQRVSAIERSDH